MNDNVTRKFENLDRLIGHTPLIRIEYEYEGHVGFVFAKLESYNYTGSIKDRIVLNILRQAYHRGEIDENTILTEATSGNTGISLAAIGAYLGNKVIIYMPDWMSVERKKLIESFGATIITVSREEGGFIGATQKAFETGSRENGFCLSQFSNRDNMLTHYEKTGLEISTSLEKNKFFIDGFISGYGTSGTLSGLGSFFKKSFANFKVFALEPKRFPINGVNTHLIAGISDDFVPELYDSKLIDDIITVDSYESILMAQKISRFLGIGVGISSGANLLGAIMASLKTGSKALFTVFSDDNKKYLSTIYAEKIEEKEEYLSSKVVLKEFIVLD